MDRDKELQRLLAQYENDALAEWAYTKALLAFRDEGDTVRAKGLLKKATKANEHIPAYLLGHKQLLHELPSAPQTCYCPGGSAHGCRKYCSIALGSPSKGWM